VQQPHLLLHVLLLLLLQTLTLWQCQPGTRLPPQCSLVPHLLAQIEVLLALPALSLLLLLLLRQRLLLLLWLHRQPPSHPE